MGAVRDIEQIADGLLRSMPELRRVAAMPDTGEFRLAGPLPARALLVCYRPAETGGWGYRMLLEDEAGASVVARPTPYPVYGGYWWDVYAVGLAWLVPESERPGGVREFKVTQRQIRELLPGGECQPYPLMPGQQLPEALQGFYRVPVAVRSVVTGPEARVLDQLGTWVSMGWRVRERERVRPSKTLT